MVNRTACASEKTAAHSAGPSHQPPGQREERVTDEHADRLSGQGGDRAGVAVAHQLVPHVDADRRGQRVGTPARSKACESVCNRREIVDEIKAHSRTPAPPRPTYRPLPHTYSADNHRYPAEQRVGAGRAMEPQDPSEQI